MEAITTHGYHDTPTYNVWSHIKARCYNPKTKSYKYYGGKGIKMCERWFDFSNFLEDMGEKPEGLSIHRKDNNLGYNPDNCVWADDKTQGREKSSTIWLTKDGITDCLVGWAERLNLRYGTIQRRVYTLGWSYEEAVFIPVGQKREKASITVMEDF